MRSSSLILRFSLSIVAIALLAGATANTVAAQTVPDNAIFSTDFESGTVDAGWVPFYSGEENLTIIDMSAAPAALATGGTKVGLIHDADASYTGIGTAIIGDINAANYTIEGDVYMYTNHDSGSAYTGLVVYADTSAGIYIKLVADFDANNRFRLYNNQFSMATFSYSFSNSIDAAGVDTSAGWHHLKVEVQTLGDNTTSFTCYYDGAMIGDAAYIDDGEDRMAHGQYGVFAFGGGAAGLPGYFDNIVVTPTVIFDEDFESGTVDAGWTTYYAGEENLQIVDMSAAPASLATGGAKVGMIHDADASYTGIGTAVIGDINSMNYTVEGDVYMYTNHDSGSAYTGLVVYADTSTGVYVKLVADFDANNRFRLYNNQFSMSTFSYSFSNSIDASGVDTTAGWHNLKVEVKNVGDSTSYTCYYDGGLLGTYVDSGSDRGAHGQWGVFAFGGGAAGLPGYFDNLKVSGGGIYEEPGVVGLDPFAGGQDAVPSSFSLAQNYPNPFNPETTIKFTLEKSTLVELNIYNVRGQLVTSLVNEYLQPNTYSFKWNGRDMAGSAVASGVYIYTLSSANQRSTKRMVLLK